MMQPSGPPLATIAEAFSRTAEKYDTFAEDHPHLTRMRNKVYDHVSRYLPAGASILELNAGSGTDAVALAARGYRVHATDVSPGMLGRARDKVQRLGLADRVTVEERSFLDLERIGRTFDAVFSDLGGLNCVADLRPVIRSLPSVLHPRGTVTWVLMPRICLWELGTIFTQGRRAFRRLARGGTQAHLEGLYFQVHYFSPRQVMDLFAEQYESLAVEGLSVITPTAENKTMARGHPRLYRALAWLDDRLAPRHPWCGWGDFFIATFRFKPG